MNLDADSRLAELSGAEVGFKGAYNGRRSERLGSRKRFRSLPEAVQHSADYFRWRVMQERSAEVPHQHDLAQNAIILVY